MKLIYDTLWAGLWKLNSLLKNISRLSCKMRSHIVALTMVCHLEFEMSRFVGLCVYSIFVLVKSLHQPFMCNTQNSTSLNQLQHRETLNYIREFKTIFIWKVLGQIKIIRFTITIKWLCNHNRVIPLNKHVWIVLKIVMFSH